MTKPTPKVDTSGSLFSMKAFKAERDLPIVYNPNYNISLWGLELMHQFDTKKYMKLAQYINDEFLDTTWARCRHFDEPLDAEEEKFKKLHPNYSINSISFRKLRFLSPNRPLNDKELLLNHTNEYIEKLKVDKSLIVKITEVWLLNLVPFNLLENNLLKPIKWQCAGTIYAAHLAMQHGWSINLGGGFHQSSTNKGETFCIYSDIMITMKYIWRKHPLQNFMIIDLDAHQATGLERDVNELSNKLRKKVFVLDMFNNSIQPPDLDADKGIDLRVELGRFTGDQTYLRKLNDNLELASTKFKPTLIIYIAGQDVLDRDSLGLMNLTDDGLKKRDEIVLKWATEKLKCPILMLIGGGYLIRGAKVFADSIKNLYTKGLIWGGHKSGERSLSRPRLEKAANNNNSSPPSPTISSHKSSGGFSGVMPAFKSIKHSHSSSSSLSKSLKHPNTNLRQHQHHNHNQQHHNQPIQKESTNEINSDEHIAAHKNPISETKNVQINNNLLKHTKISKTPPVSNNDADLNDANFKTFTISKPALDSSQTSKTSASSNPTDQPNNTPVTKKY